MHSVWFRRCRNWILIVIAVMFVWLGLFFWNSQTEFSNRIAKLQAAGIPTNISELNDFYAVPEGVQDTTDLWVAALDSVDEDAFKAVSKSLPYIGSAESPKPDDEWPEVQQAVEFLEAQSDTMDAVRRAMAAGGAVRFDVDFSPGINTLLPRTPECRNLMRLLSLDCQVAYRERDFDRVHSNLVGMLRLSGILRAEPTMISQLFGNALYAVACAESVQYVGVCDWNDEQLKQLQEQAAEGDFRATLQIGLIGEQVAMLHSLEQAPAIATLGGTTKLEALRYFEKIFASADLPWHECILKQNEVSDELLQRPGLVNELGLMMLRLTLPASGQFTASMARMEAKQRCLIGVLAMARLGAAGDEVPDVLAGLPDSVLPKSGAEIDWTDPFDGQPLRFLRSDSVLTIYSIGEDQTDNGGRLDPPSQGGDCDVGFQLKWKVDAAD